MSEMPETSDVFSGSEPITTSELQSLDRSLELAHGFKLFFVVVPAMQETQLKVFLSQMESELAFLPLKGPTENLIMVLESSEMVSKPLAVLGLSKTLENPHFAKRMLTSLNIGRDFLPEIMPVPLLLVIEPKHIKLFSEHAPDFFSVRSGLFRFKKETPFQIAAMAVKSNLKKLTYVNSKTELALTWPEFRPHFKKFNQLITTGQFKKAFALYFSKIEHSEGYLTRVLGKHETNIKLLEVLSSYSIERVTKESEKILYSLLLFKALHSLLAVGEFQRANRLLGTLFNPKPSEAVALVIAEPLTEFYSALVAQGLPAEKPNLESMGMTVAAMVEISTSLAYLNFLKGNLEESEKSFQSAELQHQRNNHNANFLDGTAGFFYGELLWLLRRSDSVERRAKLALEDAEKKGFLLEMGLAQLHLGRVAAIDGKGQNLQKAESLLKRALENLNKSQHKFFKVHGLLDLAWFYLTFGERSKATELSQEAMKLADGYPFLMVDAAGLLLRTNPEAISSDRLESLRKKARQIHYRRGLELLEAS